MKLTTTENNEIQLEEVFNSIILKTSDGEEMAICMRDTGFEFKYQGESNKEVKLIGGKKFYCENN